MLRPELTWELVPRGSTASECRCTSSARAPSSEPGGPRCGWLPSGCCVCCGAAPHDSPCSISCVTYRSAQLKPSSMGMLVWSCTAAAKAAQQLARTTSSLQACACSAVSSLPDQAGCAKAQLDAAGLLALLVQGETPVAALQPEDALKHCCLHASSGSERQTLRHVCWCWTYTIMRLSLHSSVEQRHRMTWVGAHFACGSLC